MQAIKAVLLAGVVLGGVPQTSMAASGAQEENTSRLVHDFPECGEWERSKHQVDEPQSNRGKPWSYAKSSAARNSDTYQVHCAIRQTISNIRVLRDHLGDDIDSYQGKQTFFDSSIVGLGIGSVAAAFSRSPLGWVGGIAIAASGLSQYRSYYNEEGVGAAHIKALAGARCISTNAETLLNRDPQDVWRDIATLRQAIADYDRAAKDLSAAQPAPAAPPAPAAHATVATVTAAAAATAAAVSAAQSASDAADAGAKARDAAVEALTALVAEATAFSDAPTVIDDAHDAVLNYIMQAKHRKGMDFDAIQAAVNQQIEKEKDVVAATNAARAHLFDAGTAQAKAEQKAGVPGNPSPPSSPTPDTLNSAQAQKTANSAPGATPLARSINASSALIAATKQAQLPRPGTAFTTVNRRISDCVSGLT